MTSPPDELSSIRVAISSTSTCTTATVAILTQLLLPEHGNINALADSDPKHRSKGIAGAPAPGSKVKSSTRAAKTPRTNIIDKDRGNEFPGLSLKERGSFATEVINVTLKALAEPVKTPTLGRHLTTSLDIVKETERKGLRRSNSLPQSPSNPRSLRRISSVPSVGGRSHRSCSSASSATSGALAIAECARIAFSSLRSLQSSKTSGISDLPPFQIERGMSALVGKLISLGLDDLAVLELRILKRRLDPLPKPLKQIQRKGNEAKGTTSSSNRVENLAEIIRFETSPSPGPCLSLAIATQLHALKLLASSKRSSLIHASISSLRYDFPYSPTRLLRKALNDSTLSKQKSAKYLEMLCQLLLSICPSISSAEDEAALSPELSPSPEVALELQVIAFHNRALWWNLAGHRGDIFKDMIEPFTKCLTSFARRCYLERPEAYAIAVRQFHNFREAVSHYDKNYSTDMTSAFSDVYKILTSLAQDAKSYVDAIQWSEKFQSTAETSASEARRCSMAASILASRLMTMPNDPGVEKLLLEVIEGISGTLRGSSQELEDLVTEVSHARRAAISILSTHRARQSASDSLADGVRQMCESFVIQCPRFMLRFLGSRPDATKAPKDAIRYEQRRRFFTKSANNTVDSALYLIKVIQSDGHMTWELMDSTLHDCHSLLERIEDTSSAGKRSEELDGVVSYFVKISNLYYSQHLNMRRDAETSKSSLYLRPLRRSVDCIRYRSTLEKNAAAFVIRLERLVELLRSMDRLDEALEMAFLLRDELINCGILAKVAAMARKVSIRDSWEQSEDTSMLGRAVAVILRLGAKLKRKDPRLCQQDWAADERGVILEHCMEISSRSSKDSDALYSIFKQLFSLYVPKDYPIRRLRVTIRLLRLDTHQRQVWDSDIKSSVTLAGIDQLVLGSKDAALQPYLPHLQALASTIQELQEDHPRIELLKPHLASWYSLLEKLEDHESSSSQIDDILYFVNHLHSIADYLHMKGVYNLRLAVLQMLVKINEIRNQENIPDDAVFDYIVLGLQYLELGYSFQAGIILGKAQSVADTKRLDGETLVRLQLAQAEYSAAIGDFNKCEEFLCRAQRTASRRPDGSRLGESEEGSSEKLETKSILANVHFLYSLLYLERGFANAALSHAKKSLRFCRFAWETPAAQRSLSFTPALVEGITEDMASMNLSTMSSPAQPRTRSPLGPSLWASVNPLFRTLMHLSKLYAHHGLFRETMYYANQAHELVTTTESSPYMASSLSIKGNIWLDAGVLDQASECLVKARESSISAGESCANITLTCHLGKLHGLMGDQDSSRASYDEARKVLDRLTNATYIANIGRLVDTVSLLEQEMSQLLIKSKKSNVRKLSTKKSPIKKRSRMPKTRPVEDAPIISESLELVSIRGEFLRQKANALMLWDQGDEALSVLKEADSCSRTLSDILDHKIASSRQLLLQAVEEINAHPLFNTLQDSTISLPAIAGSTRTSSVGSETLSTIRPAPPRQGSNNISSRERSRAKSPGLSKFCELLKRVYDQMSDAHSSAVQASSTSVVHNLSSLLNTAAILLSATGALQENPIAHPGFAACSIEIARINALERERSAIHDDLENSANKLERAVWPNPLVVPAMHAQSGPMAEMDRFQQDYIDIIPPEWTAISISLSDNEKELCITKMSAGTGPFVLRLPLGRNTLRDVEEEIFDFNQGKTELNEIISAANYTSHSARDLKGREAKVAWWEERKELDIRMKDLLDNMENVWLGGFKGIFSQQPRQPELLARFQKTFYLILEKHLPSRQNGGRKKNAALVTLDLRILELFIGLGDATLVERIDLEEPLIDLLYFVVDILQFHGEKNALDEVPFQSMAFDTIEALRCYYETIKPSSTLTERNSHTILILDKALHAFPWESLPCMDGLAVSRLPSMCCLRTRLSNHERKSSIAGHQIDRASGSYILNPGGDLKSTQFAFESSLHSLSTWNAIVNTAPSESDFKESLESKDLVLYFGHGSGAQYIRAKTIKRLRKCAVTMLMGCSSGALNQVGEFESYGPPMDYMLAGSPAVVATLWDVTDQDIDRFAKSTFEHWGLFGSKGAAAKGKGKRVADQERPSCGKISLVEAVAKGRGACNFRYLTAAAVCVYGIPVYFK